MVGREKAQAKESRAVNLRLVGGLTFARVAQSWFQVCPAHKPDGLDGCPLCERMYASAGSARRAVHRALSRDYPPPTGEQRAAYVAEQNGQITLLLSAAMRDALNQNLPLDDRHRAMAAAQRFMVRRASLLGLDAERAETDDAMGAEIQALVDELVALGSEAPNRNEVA